MAEQSSEERRVTYQKRRAGGTTPVGLEECRRRALETPLVEKALQIASVSERHRLKECQECASTRSERQGTPAWMWR